MNLQRNLAACALAMAALPASAQSSVQVYGLVDAMAYRKQLAGEAKVNRLDSGGLSTSFWGVRGSEDLGGGLSAQFDLTSFFRVDAGVPGRSDTDPYFARSSWVGLQGAWGGVRLGRQSTLAFINLVRYNAFGGSTTFGPSALHNYLASVTQPQMTAIGAADSVWNNVISYTTPSMGNFSGSFFCAPSEGTTAGRRVGASLAFNSGALSVGLVTEKISAMALNFSKPPANVRIDESQVWNLGASYDFKVAKLFAQVVQTALRNPTTRIDFDTYNIGATVPVGAGQFMVSYGETAKSQTALADTKRRTATLAYEYNLSKRSDVYGVLINDRATRIADGTGIAFGIRHRF